MSTIVQRAFPALFAAGLISVAPPQKLPSRKPPPDDVRLRRNALKRLRTRQRREYLARKRAKESAERIARWRMEGKAA